jgi:hypothetical protein
MVSDNSIESIQIQSLQNVVRFQDELLRENLGTSKDLYNTWRNECYRLSIQKQTVEEECMQLIQSMKQQNSITLSSLQSSIFKELDSLERDSRKRIIQSLKSLEDKLRSSERKLRFFDRKACGRVSHMESDEDKAGSELSTRLKTLEDQLACLQTENAKLKSELEYSRNKPTTPKPLVRNTKRCMVPCDNQGKDEEINLLLAQLKSLEIEAKQMLIKK